MAGVSPDDGLYEMRKRAYGPDKTYRAAEPLLCARLAFAKSPASPVFSACPVSPLIVPKEERGIER